MCRFFWIDIFGKYLTNDASRKTGLCIIEQVIVFAVSVYIRWGRMNCGCPVVFDATLRWVEWQYVLWNIRMALLWFVYYG